MPKTNPIMAPIVREKFSSQAAPEVLAALRQVAKAQGRPFQSVIDEALRDYIDRRQGRRPRRHAMIDTVPAGKRIGVAKGQFNVPDSIDAHSAEVARLFLGGQS